MKCDICEKEVKTYKLVLVSELQKGKMPEDWASEKQIIGHKKCIENMNFMDITKATQKIQDFKVRMRELCANENVSVITMSRIENIMEKCLGE